MSGAGAKGEGFEERFREKAAEAGIVIAPERFSDVLEGARRLEAAAGRVRRFAAELGSTDPAS